MSVKLGVELNPMISGWCDSCGGPKKEDNTSKVRRISTGRGPPMFLCINCLRELYVEIKAALEE